MRIQPIKQSLLVREFLTLDRRAQGGGISVEEMERWATLKRAIEERLGVPSLKGIADTRRSLRLPLSLKVEFETEHELAGALMRNLSRGGFFIETKDPLPIGSIFRSLVRVEDWRLEVRPLVRVISHHVGPALETRPCGMGVAFHELCEAERRTIDAIYERCLGEVLA